MRQEVSEVEIADDTSCFIIIDFYRNILVSKIKLSYFELDVGLCIIF